MMLHNFFGRHLVDFKASHWDRGRFVSHYRLRLRDDQTTRPGMAGERTAELRRSALPLDRRESLY